MVIGFLTVPPAETVSAGYIKDYFRSAQLDFSEREKPVLVYKSDIPQDQELDKTIIESLAQAARATSEYFGPQFAFIMLLLIDPTRLKIKIKVYPRGALPLAL